MGWCKPAKSAWSAFPITHKRKKTRCVGFESPARLPAIGIFTRALTMLRDGSLDRCMTNDTAFLAWSPLAGGKLISGDNMPSALMAKIDELAARENTDRAGIALAFVLAHPAAPIAIIGSQNLSRIETQGRL